MKIYTRKGDEGNSSLIGGTRVRKYDLRLEAYGTVDELNSWLGLLRDQLETNEHPQHLIQIQDRLFVIGALLANDPESSSMKLPSLSEQDITDLETAIDTMDAQLPEMRNFILPGGHSLVSQCHIARCVCRRTERITVELSDHQAVDPLIVRYLNRLSDFLFVLARFIAMQRQVEELPWKPRE